MCETLREPVKVLKSLSEQAINKQYKFKRLYRNLYNPEFYFLAYKNISQSQGSMTSGVDGKSLDGIQEKEHRQNRERKILLRYRSRRQHHRRDRRKKEHRFLFRGTGRFWTIRTMTAQSSF